MSLEQPVSSGWPPSDFESAKALLFIVDSK